MAAKLSFACVVTLATISANAGAESADWQQVIWRKSQVRYLLADMTLRGKVL